MKTLIKRFMHACCIAVVSIVLIGCGQDDNNTSKSIACMDDMVAEMADVTTMYANALENSADAGSETEAKKDEKTEIAKPLDTSLTKREALDILFEYLYGDGEDLTELVFCDGEEISYRWHLVPGRYTFLQEDGCSFDGQYILFMIWNSLYNPEDGIQYRWEWLNEYAVNLNTGEIMECIEFDEYGIKNFTDDYDKYILGKETDTDND